MNETAKSFSFFRAAIWIGMGLGLGIAGTWLALRTPHAQEHGQETQAQAPKKQMYQCPMHPQIMMDHEAACPICGMDLVAMEGAGEGAPGTVTIDAQRQQLIGLKTVKVEEGPLGGELRTNGRVAVDETRVRKITVKVEGFVEKLFVDFVGKPVAEGAPLFSLYSPDFVSAQQEYLLALKTSRQLAGGAFQGSGSELLEAARERLKLWDVPPSEIEELEKRGEARRTLTLRSPLSGVVTAKNVQEGARITPLDQILEITDLSHVWVLADIYETELGRVKVGTAAEFSSGAYPGRSFKGRVAFIDPQMDPKTRTVKVRVEFANGSGELKPELFGEVVLKGPVRKGLRVPLDAVLDSGIRKVVFIAAGEGRFEPRAVEVGERTGEFVEILSGIDPGVEVVTGANFLVDSESRLKAALSQMGGAK